MAKRWNPDQPGRWARCGHGHCSDCKTRRGRNYGTRRVRYAVKAGLRALRKEA